MGLIPLVASRKKVLVLTVVSGILAQAATVVSIALGAWLVGLAAYGAGAEQLKGTGLALLVSVVTAALCRWWQSYVSHDLAFALIEVLQVGIFDGLERAAPGYVLGQRTGDLASVATGDAEMMEEFYAHLLGDYVGAVIVPLGALIGLALIHPLIGLAVLPFLPLVASAPFWLARKAGEHGRALTQAKGLLNAEIVEGLQGMREISAFGYGGTFLQRLSARTGQIANLRRTFSARSGLEQGAIELLLALAVLTCAGVAAVLVARGLVEPALLPVAVALTGAALLPITEATATGRKIGELRAAAERILAILRQKAQVPDVGKEAVSGPATVEFDRVRFSYGARGMVLHEVTFSIRPGETVALVGHSGAGKSTIASLLMRFWDVESGVIRVGGRDIRTLPIKHLRELIAMVPQDVYLFDASIADNIRLGRPGASDEEVQQAAARAQAHEFIRQLPQGYDTPCGERGAMLSGGQRQRIAIARALLRGAPILLFDEAASSLDAENERAFQAALEELRGSHTILVIAHRTSTIEAADRVVVLQDGSVKERAKSADLAAAQDQR